jgi:hypothetical protein
MTCWNTKNCGLCIWEMIEITVEVKCHFVLMMHEDFEVNVNLGVYMVMKINWMTGIKGKYRNEGFEILGKWNSDKQNSSGRNRRQ